MKNYFQLCPRLFFLLILFGDTGGRRKNLGFLRGRSAFHGRNGRGRRIRRCSLLWGSVCCRTLNGSCIFRGWKGWISTAFTSGRDGYGNVDISLSAGRGSGSDIRRGLRGPRFRSAHIHAGTHQRFSRRAYGMGKLITGTTRRRRRWLRRRHGRRGRSVLWRGGRHGRSDGCWRGGNALAGIDSDRNL